MAEYIFWLCLVLPLYAWVGYPVLLTLAAPLFRRRAPAPLVPQTVSVVIAAHNEERHIEQKLRSVLNQDYAAAALQVVVASDGSSDRTVALARDLGDKRVLVLDLPRLGKAGALNTAVNYCRGDILVFTDADNQW
ncbi:MAG TPA: glycosyltransferase, partial [Pseudomonas sp.]|uniref:glycosyltransferase n=1 Tax=Pseudomonas sp. TaxID=306 RepID=UPI002B467545